MQRAELNCTFCLRLGLCQLPPAAEELSPIPPRPTAEHREKGGFSFPMSPDDENPFRSSCILESGTVRGRIRDLAESCKNRERKIWVEGRLGGG